MSTAGPVGHEPPTDPAGRLAACFHELAGAAGEAVPRLSKGVSMVSNNALATCYQLAGSLGHRLDLVGATGDRRGELTCVGCGHTGTDLLTHLLAVAADVLVDGGVLTRADHAEFVRRIPEFDGSLPELIAVVDGGGRATRKVADQPSRDSVDGEADRSDQERRLAALDAFIAEFEVEHGAITDDEMNAAAERLRNDAG